MSKIKRSKIDNIIMECHREVYAFIGVDFDALIVNGDTKEEGWFLKYHLNHAKQQEIVNSVLNRYKLTPSEESKIEINVWLGGLPSSS